MTKVKAPKLPDQGVSQTREIMRRFKKNRSAMIGLTIFLIICLLAILADVITPYSKAITQVKDARLLAPSAQHLFGTDHLGRDMFARVLHARAILWPSPWPSAPALSSLALCWAASPVTTAA